jgi:hypothetical protein
MTTLREAAQQALEALEAMQSYAAAERKGLRICDEAITALRAALAGPCPCGDRPADQCPGEWEPGCDLGNNPKYAKRAEPKGGGNLPPPLQAEPVAAVAENATTQQFVGETPPSDYRRGYWDGFNIGKREGRIEAEDALAQQALEPVQEPVAFVNAAHLQGLTLGLYGYVEIYTEESAGRVPLYTTPPQRKPLTEEEIDVTTAQERDALLDHIYEYGTAAEGVLERIRKLCRAIERAHGIKE